ncbi:MAG: hypothetical protein AAGF31_07345 [Planctomycetota bacterium]
MNDTNTEPAPWLESPRLEVFSAALQEGFGRCHSNWAPAAQTVGKGK